MTNEMMTRIANERRKKLKTVRHYDYELQSYHDSKMSEFVISQGGDVMTFRVYGTEYNTMEVYER